MSVRSINTRIQSTSARVQASVVHMQGHRPQCQQASPGHEGSSGESLEGPPGSATTTRNDTQQCRHPFHSRHSFSLLLSFTHFLGFYPYDAYRQMRRPSRLATTCAFPLLSILQGILYTTRRLFPILFFFAFRIFDRPATEHLRGTKGGTSTAHCGRCIFGP